MRRTSHLWHFGHVHFVVLELLFFLFFCKQKVVMLLRLICFISLLRGCARCPKWLVCDFARIIFVSFFFVSYDYCCYCSSFNSCHLLCFLSEKPMFQNSECDASVGSIAKAFVPTGMLNLDSADVVLYSLRQKYRDTDKLIVPRWVTVSILLCR